VLSHGAALGVGLTAMGAADWTVVQELKELLDTDSAVAGEAAGMAIGLVLLGTGAGNAHNNLTRNAEELNELVLELKNYARETQHEKIIRGIAMGLALMNYGQEEHADAAIEEMRSDRDPVMRYGAQYALALAYCGTGSNRAIRILLHTAVSDVSDDVRMAAVIGLAFVLCKTPERVPQLVKLLLESFNPHVRYASCMAVGLAMAGTGDPESISLLEPMLDDMTDYVRQGALMGTAMIYMQQSDTCNNRKIKSFRERIAAIVTEKHQTTLTKMGAILATGIIDAGGRNCSLTLGSRNGFTKMSTAAGLALWLQHWHWYPMMQMFSLVLTPTCTIGLNKEFKYPKKFEILCNAKPSAFAYPKKLEEKKEEAKKRVETVTLSTTAKEKARLARKRAKMGEKEADGKEAETATPDATAKTEGDAEAMDVDKIADGKAPEVADGKAPDDVEAAKPKKKREPEPLSFRVGNPSRITLAQSKVCEFDMKQRYRPVRFKETPIGVIILTDSKPQDEEEDLGTVKSPSLEPEGELAPPEPFEWTPPFPLAGPVDSGASTSSSET
jgi:26S proteasome regulatory subunit N2